MEFASLPFCDVLKQFLIEIEKRRKSVSLFKLSGAAEKRREDSQKTPSAFRSELAF